jgi:hypothetical protein
MVTASGAGHCYCGAETIRRQLGLVNAGPAGRLPRSLRSSLLDVIHRALPLFVPFARERMEALPVHPWVSDPKHERARCLEPMGA